MGRIGLLGRVILILMLALFAVTIAALAIERYEAMAEPPGFPTPYPRIEQAASIITLLRRTDPVIRDAILRAASGAHLRASVVGQVSFEAAKFRRAPRIEATLRAFAPGLDDDDVRAYTDAAFQPNAASNPGTEGILARVTWRMPDGHVLLLDELQPPPPPKLWILGAPPGLWVGLLGLVVAGLALFTAEREMRPLRRLTAAASAFDGSPPEAPPETGGAPDIGRLANAVHGMQERVSALLQERAFVTGAISHDLKTFLTRLRLRAEGIADADLRAPFVDDLDAMTELIDNALAFARGMTVSQRQGRIDLADLAAIEAAERAALGQTVLLIGDESDAVVSGDPVALRRVITNLVDNAVKFGRTRVELSLGADVDFYRLRVDDDGPGVTEANRSVIFSPFYRIEGSRNRKTGGSGLGLAIARQIVEAHSGSITIEDGRLGGACFILTLPKPQAPEHR